MGSILDHCRSNPTTTRRSDSSRVSAGASTRIYKCHHAVLSKVRLLEPQPCDTDVMDPLFSVSRRSAYNSLLGIAVGWMLTLILFGLLAELSGYLGSRRELREVLLAYWWLWLGPLLLISGSSLGLRGIWKAASIVLIWIGCFSLTAMVSDLVMALVRDAADPLIAKPDMGLVLFLVVSIALALWGDATAFRLSRKSKYLA